MIRKADVTLVVSPVEQKLLHELLPEARVMILSNIHEPVAGGKPFAEREGLVFIGGFQHPPNTDAVLWYAQEILPRVRAAAAGREDLHRRQQGAGDDPGARHRRPDRHRLRPRRHAVLQRLPRVDRAAALRRRRQGQGQLGDEPRAAGGRHLDRRSRACTCARRRTSSSPTTRRRSPTRSCASTATKRCGRSSPAGGVDNIRRHFSRDVARKAVKQLIALANGSGIAKAA